MHVPLGPFAGTAGSPILMPAAVAATLIPTAPKAPTPIDPSRSYRTSPKPSFHRA